MIFIDGFYIVKNNLYHKYHNLAAYSYKSINNIGEKQRKNYFNISIYLHRRRYNNL
jgi:hypothetical protein